MFLVGHAPDAAAVGNSLVYRCVISGDQEVGPTPSSGFGGGEFRIDPVANTVTYRIVFTGLLAAETAAHIHGMANPGANAGVLHGLPAGNPKTGTWNYLEAQEAGILAGQTYVNIHSSAFPGGEIRGQIVPLNAQLDGAQEVPAIPTTGRGWGTFTIDMPANQLAYHIAFTGLSAAETAAHIHGSAAHGANAGVLHGLPLGSPKIGVWNYSDAQEADILAGRTYVNVHSTAFPGGEIRGQIVPIVAPIDAGQEVPSNASTGAGIGLFSIDQANDVLGYDIRVAGLTTPETAAHIHGYSPPGVNSGVQHPLPSGARKLGVWNYPTGDEANIETGLIYVNVHTSMFPGGELRGQIQGFDCPPAVAVPEVIAAGPAHLLANAPNPFDGRTTIRFDLTRESGVRLTVIDTGGRRVRSLLTKTLPPGVHRIAWDGRDNAGARVANGVYYTMLETTEGVASRSVTLIR
jgi:hypothetical protein